MGMSALVAGGLAIACALWFRAVGRPAGNRILGPAAVALLAADLWCSNSDFHRFKRPSFYEEIPSTVAFLEQDGSRFRAYVPRSSWEAKPVEESGVHELAGLDAGLGSLYRIGTVRDPVERTVGMPNTRLIQFMKPPSLRRLGAANVKYVLASSSTGRLPPGGIFRKGGKCIYQNPRCLERVRLCERYELTPGPAAILERIDASSFDPTTTVLLEGRPTFTPSSRPVTPGVPREPRITHYGSCDVAIEAATQRAGILVLADFYYPGWRCFVNGRPTTILRANSIFRGVGLGAGKHRVRFIYKPASFFLGLFVGHVVVALLAVWAGFRLRQAQGLNRQAPCAPPSTRVDTDLSGIGS